MGFARPGLNPENLPTLKQRHTDILLEHMKDALCTKKKVNYYTARTRISIFIKYLKMQVLEDEAGVPTTTIINATIYR